MFKNNLKIAFRNLVKNKSFSLINIGGLAIGIASCMLLLLYVNYEWSFNKQVKDYNRIYVLYTNQFGSDQIFSFTATPAPLAPAIQQSVPGVEAIVRTISADNFQKDGGLLSYKNNSFTKDGLYADSSFFKVFNYHFIEGDPATALNEPNSIVLTQSMANILFKKDDPLNKMIQWNVNEYLKVTGVVEDFPSNSWAGTYNYVLNWHLLEKEQPWTKNDQWGSNFCTTFLKLKDNRFFASSDKLTRSLIGAHQNNVKGANQAFMFPFSKWHLYNKFENGKSVGGDISKLRVFLILAFCILLIACINFMNLSTAQTQKRAREVGIRKVVGSSNGALVRQFMGESALYVIISLILAIILVELSLPFFNRLLSINLQVAYSSPYLWLGMVAIFVITSLVAGSYPAFYLSSFAPVKVLKGTTKTSSGTLSLRKVLVVFQFMFTVSLIIAIAVIYLQINFIKNKPVGYNQNNLLEIPLKGDLQKKVSLFKNELLQSGFVSSACPMNISMTQGGYNGWGVSWPGKSPDEQILFDFLFTGYDFVKTTGLHITKGRDFSRQFPSDSTGVLVSAAAVKIMGLKDPVGSVIQWGASVKIIGVFDDFAKNSPFKKGNPMIVGLGSSDDQFGIMSVRVNPGKGLVAAVNKIEDIQKTLDPAYPPQVNFVSQEFEQKFESEKLLGSLANLFGGLAIFISCLGLFGLTLYTAEQRTKEIGIRRVLGASLNNLMFLVSKEFIVLVIIAAVLACPVGYYFMNKWLANYEFRIEIHWYVYVIAFLAALVIALLAVGGQAWRAAKADPVKALKYE